MKSINNFIEFLIVILYFIITLYYLYYYVSELEQDIFMLKIYINIYLVLFLKVFDFFLTTILKTINLIIQENIFSL